jgi:hypothetical protein
MVSVARPHPAGHESDRPAKAADEPSEVVEAVNPDVLIFDVGLPYAVNWYYAEVLKMSLPNLPIVLTTANRTALKEIVGANGAFELTGTPQNLSALLEFVYARCGRTADGQVDVKSR